MVVAVNPKSIFGRTATKFQDNFVGKLRRQPFVRVEDQDPFMLGLRNRPILEIARRDVFAVNHPNFLEFERDLDRIIL